MKPYGITAILGLHLILGVVLVLNFIYSEQADKAYSDVVMSFICIGIFAGLKERNDLARKFTIFYYSTAIIILLIQFVVGGPLMEESIITNLATLIVSAAIITYLIKPTTKLQFTT